MFKIGRMDWGVPNAISGMRDGLQIGDEGVSLTDGRGVSEIRRGRTTFFGNEVCDGRPYCWSLYNCVLRRFFTGDARKKDSGVVCKP